ncbi:MAG: hypothetical protein KGJ98_12485 [Chloroflexota bacterium]|nr:hypothetical protein [Chloroflexota bacterium]
MLLGAVVAMAIARLAAAAHLLTITGAKSERAFDYAQRLQRVFEASTSDIADVLIVEFSAPLQSSAV